jgi:hypothetical protein
LRCAPARFRPDESIPARSAGSLPAGRLPAGPGDPLDEPGWSLGSEDQAGNHHGDRPPLEVNLGRVCRQLRLPVQLSTAIGNTVMAVYKTAADRPRRTASRRATSWATWSGPSTTGACAAHPRRRPARPRPRRSHAVGAAARGPLPAPGPPGGDRVPPAGPGPSLQLAGPAGRRGLALPRVPGFEEHFWVTTDASTWYLVFLGRVGLSQATDDGTQRVDGLPSLVRAPAALVPPASLSGRRARRWSASSWQHADNPPPPSCIRSGIERTCVRVKLLLHW